DANDNLGLRGGAHELSQILESQVAKDPVRFVDLAEGIPEDAHPYFFDAILRGVTEADVEIGVAAKICRRCHQLPNRPNGRWLCRLVQKYAASDVPSDLLEMVAWYATEDADPSEYFWRVTPGSGKA